MKRGKLKVKSRRLKEATMQPHESRCLECGAPMVNGLTCWDMLGAIIAWEFQDPELLAEHFLTVASYNLQHPAQFTEATLAGLWAVFIERIDHGLGITEIRRRVGKATAGATRVLRPEAERHPVLRQWSMTIADVYLPEQPQGAAERVRAWASVIRREC
jgi:hypothetical protein